MKQQAQICRSEVQRRVLEEKVLVKSLQAIVRRLNKQVSDGIRDREVIREEVFT